MCLLIAISGVVADAPLLIAANRDEFYDRYAVCLTVLQDTEPRMLGGRDLVAGGTWLAVNEHGVVAALTNKPTDGQRDPAKRSRGEIPLLLAAQASASAAVDALESTFERDSFNPCWVLVGDRRALYYLDMTGPEGVKIELLPPGVHILENKPLGSPSKKVDHVRELLGDCEKCSADEVIAGFGGLLGDHLMPLLPIDGSEAAERQSRISACCVHTELYGTRSAMVVCDPPSASDEPRVWVADGPPCTHPFSPVAFDQFFDSRAGG